MGELTRRTQQIESLLEELSPDELLALIEHIARRVHLREERKPQPLYGIWRGKFPEDANINATLKEIRINGKGILRSLGSERLCLHRRFR